MNDVQYLLVSFSSSTSSSTARSTSMSTPMDDTYFASDMDNYTLNHYTEPPYGNNNNIDINSVDPRLLGSPQNTAILSHESPHEHYPQSNLLSPSYNLFAGLPAQTQYFDPIHSYEPMRHQMLGHRRSVSVPPEDLMPENVQPPPPAVVFHRGGTPLGDSMGSGGGGDGVVGKKWLKKAAAAQRRQMQRHAPYPVAGDEKTGGRKKMQYTPQGPTSAPQMFLRDEDVAGVMREFHDSTPIPQFEGFDRLVSPGHGGSPVQLSKEFTDIDALTFGRRSDVDTAVMGMLGFTERLSKDCDAMKRFLARGFKSVHDDDNDDEDDEEGDKLERTRREKRVLNREISSLEDDLEPLPLPEPKNDEKPSVPITGQHIRELDLGKTDALLKVYGIAFPADVFLHDKKMAYLRFVGASRALMHLVLD